MKIKNLHSFLLLGFLLLAIISDTKAQETIYNNFGPDHDGWGYTHTMGWTISGYDVEQQYGVEQALGFDSDRSGFLSDIWVAISYCNPSSLPDTVVLFLVENPDGSPPDSANIIEEWTLYDFNSWSQWNTPFHLIGNGTSYIEEGKSYWLWAIGKETTWAMWCMNEDASLTCPHTIRREGEDWLGISNETASAFRIDIITNVGIGKPEIYEANSLSQNYPNPFQYSTEISFNLENAEHVQLIIYDMYGRAIEVLTDGNMEAGKHTITYNPDQIQDGIYLCTLLVDNQVVGMKKMSYQK
ncbi:MAG: T9SS type A sorting domain-containing protein [Bacteroidota bacterium]|nr:T9SS type A sorting domain-containing protein [Bacteroidota bacterium]